jgi:PIN domain nuclease of toxin-antitoxin system
MRFLLDTHLLLWTAASEELTPNKFLTKQAQAFIADAANELHFSPASIWEVAIKNALGKPDFRVDPHLLRRALLDNGYVELPITSEHAAAVANLAGHHKDPFDRLLLAQATVEGIELLTTDGLLIAYKTNPVRFVGS